MQNIGILVGSLRKGAFSRAVGETLKEILSSKEIKSEIVPIGDLPLFNQDNEEEGKEPDSYGVYRKKMKEFEGYLVVTPEYNRSLPAALKNAMDIASRPYGESVFEGKHVGVISCSPGLLGGAMAALDAKKILSCCGGKVMGNPEVYLGRIHMAVKEGRVSDAKVLSLLEGFISQFLAF